MAVLASSVAKRKFRIFKASPVFSSGKLSNLVSSIYVALSPRSRSMYMRNLYAGRPSVPSSGVSPLSVDMHQPPFRVTSL